MKNLKLKKTMTKLISMVLVLATVMGISCTCIVSASAQSMSSTEVLAYNSIDTKNHEKMSLNDIMFLVMLMMSKSETEKREALSALTKSMYEEILKQIAESGYDKDDVINFLQENLDLKGYEETIQIIKEKISSKEDLVNRFKDNMNSRNLLY